MSQGCGWGSGDTAALGSRYTFRNWENECKIGLGPPWAFCEMDSGSDLHLLPTSSTPTLTRGPQWLPGALGINIRSGCVPKDLENV